MENERKRRAAAKPESRASDPALHRSDHAADMAKVAKDRAVVAAGYIVGERPALLRRDNFLSVINNQKCTLYDCKDARKLYDLESHADMVVSCDSCAYNEEMDLLFTASYDGILKIYLVRSHGKEAPQQSLLATFRLCREGLLCVKASKAIGELIYLYSVGGPSGETVVARLSLDYDNLIHTEQDFDVNAPIVVPAPAGVDCEPNATDHDEGIPGDHEEQCTATGEASAIVRKLDMGELCRSMVRHNVVLCTLPPRVDVFATDADLGALAFAIGKTAIILDMKMKKIVFFECFSSISCMAFFTGHSLAVGDSRGRIGIYNIDPAKEAQITDNLVVACDMPDERFQLSATYFKKILLAFHSSSTNPRDLSDYKEFRNFKRVTASVNTLIWHAHGVNCLSFNSDGSVLLSGGEEGVLVVWYLNSGSKKFVTRIGSAILHILSQRDHGIYILCCEANEIMFVDPFALCIRKRITGITIPINVGMKTNKEVNALHLPNEHSSRELVPAGNVDINKAHVLLTVVGDPAVPLIQHWPTNLTESFMHAAGDTETIVGGNVVIYARSNKLQIYDYVHDREVGSLLLKNVNILSRQDDDFGQDWDLEELLISHDGHVVVTVQSRNVLNKLGPPNEKVAGNSAILPEFEHEVISNNRKGLLKFWIKQKGADSDSSAMVNYMEHTKISNPHSHKTTSVRQLNDQYAFLTTSLDSEFKLWHNIRKRVLKSDNVFETYRALDISESDYQVDINDPDSYMWVCVAVGSYKNMPCFASSITDGGRLLAISHDVVVTFWKVGAAHNTVELVGAVPLPKDEKDDDDEVLGSSCSKQYLTFLYPSQPRRLLFSKRSMLCVLDVSQGTVLWNYPVARGQVVDKVVYSMQMPNLVVMSTSYVDEASIECSGVLEMIWLTDDPVSGFRAEPFYRSQREISRVVLNMCCSPSAFGYSKQKRRADKIEPLNPALEGNVMVSTLVLLTANFNLETVLIVSDLYGEGKPRIMDITTVPRQQVVPRKALRLTRSQQFDLITQLMSTIKATREAPGTKKRVKYNISEQLCKESEWKHRVKYPMPKSILSAMVDPGCPTTALPPPNVVLNRLLHLVTAKHQRQSS